MKLKKFDWVTVTKPGPTLGMVGEIVDLGPGEYHVAIDEVSKFFWLTEDEVQYWGRM